MDCANCHSKVKKEHCVDIDPLAVWLVGGKCDYEAAVLLKGDC